MDPILEVSELSKRFGDRRAVRSISFSVFPGEIFGLLGPNGAGKTTTLGMIAGVLPPSGGSVRVAGSEVSGTGRAALRKLGLVPQSIALYPALTAEENLRLLGRLYDVQDAELARRVDALLELAGLIERRSEAVGHFSGGMKRRLSFACGLVHGPAVVLLDEPTLGVDPQSRERIYDGIRELASRGLALLLTTHYMDEAERLCHRLAILDEGQVAATGTVAELRALVGEEAKVRIRLAQVPGAELSARLAQLGGVAEDPRSFRLEKAGADRYLPEILERVASDGNSVEGLRLNRPNLGDVFLHLTGKALRD
jgi:ABC-2 type transport system ATP-binding protein